MADYVIMLEDFQKEIGSYPSGGGSGTIAVDTVITKNGQQTIRLTPTAGSNINVQFPVSNDFVNGDYISFFVYINNVNATNSLTLYVSNNNFASFFSKGYNAAGAKVGWNHIVLSKSEFTTTNGATWDAVDKLQIRATAGSGQTFYICLDSVYWRANERTRILVDLDDGFASCYNIVYPYATNLGIKCNVYALSGVSPGTYMSVAQLTELYNAGWDVCNHTILHEDLSTLTLEEATATLNTCKAWLLANGFTRSFDHLAYPVNLPNATAIQAASDVGMKTARTIFGTRSYIHQRKDLLEVPGRGAGQGIALSTITGDIDTAIAKGGTYMFYAHDIAESETLANQWATSKMYGLLDYLADKRDQGLLDILTITEWYDIAITEHQFSCWRPFSGIMPDLALLASESSVVVGAQIWEDQNVTTEKINKYLKPHGNFVMDGNNYVING